MLFLAVVGRLEAAEEMRQRPELVVANSGIVLRPARGTGHGAALTIATIASIAAARTACAELLSDSVNGLIAAASLVASAMLGPHPVSQAASHIRRRGDEARVVSRFGHD